MTLLFNPFQIYAIEDQFEISVSVTSAETAAPSAPSAPAGGGAGQFVYPVIYDIRVSPDVDRAVITWKTNVPTINSLKWGLSSSFETGETSEIAYGIEHSATLNSLIGDTNYYFIISAVSEFGIRTTTPQMTFRTAKIAEATLNPLWFTAKAKEQTIYLQWKNSSHPDFEEVRLVKNKGFYPSDPSDGEVIYEGGLEFFEDSDVVVGEKYYYAIFAKDKNGNYSSGLVASARIPFPGEPLEPEKPIFEELPKAPGVHPIIAALTILDFDFIQDGKKIARFSGGSVGIDGAKNLTVSLDYGKVPEVLKSILVTLAYPTDEKRIFSFMLRVNNEKTAYTATIGPLGESGRYDVRIAIVDFKNRGLKEIVGELLASVGLAKSYERGFIATGAGFIKEKLNWILLLALLFIIGRRVVIKRRRSVAGVV